MRSKGTERAADPPAVADPITAGMIPSEQPPVSLDKTGIFVYLKKWSSRVYSKSSDTIFSIYASVSP